MPDTSIDALVKQAISANPVLAKLLEAKAHSDKSRYELKNQILKELMDQSPEDWVIDDPKPKYKGVTHLPTKFRLHADPRFINPNVKIQSSIEDLAKQAFETHTLVHYSGNKYDTLRPLSYEELLKHRTSGRWKDQPEQAKKYTEERRKFEKELHKRLAAKGITTNPDNSFLYATLLGHENFGSSDQVKHEAPLTPDLIAQSFFDVVGAGKSYTALGQRGLSRALTRWQKAKDEGKLMPYEYMGMTINPRIEVMTPAQIKPSLVTEPIPDLAKQAAAYTVSGEKVQGVGLRKLYHQLLDEQKLPGLAVNNEETGDVELTFGGDEEKRKKVFDELAKRIQAKTQHPVSYQELLGDSNLLPINLKNSDIAKINARNHLAYRMSKYYNPADSQMKPDSQTQAELAERFRLTPKGKGLIGNVSPRAMDQLLGKRPMYQAMLPANLIRGIDETLQETPEDIRNRILKTLKTDKGFLASSIPDLAKQAALKPDVQLQPHQQRIIDRMNAGDNRLLLYHGLGSGKSLSSLAAAEAAGGDYTAVTPASLRQNYEKEIEKFTEGSNPEVMSYTGIGSGKTPKKTPQTIIFDEAHRLRNPSTAGARAASYLTNQAKNLLLLTGTPITNHPSDLASLVSLLHNEEISPEEFKKHFVGYKKVYPSLISRLTGRGAGEEVFVKNEDELRNLFRGKVDYQPSKTPEGVNVQEEIVKVPLGSQQERIQNAIISKIPPEWAWKLNKEFPLSRDELKSLNSFLTGLRQSSLSTQPFRKDKNMLTAFQQSAKLQKAYADLQEELNSDPRKKAIVYSNFIDAGINPYAAALESNKVPYGVFHGGIPLKQRKKTLQDYNEGKIRALLLGPAAAEGISTKGTNLIQLLDPHWHESRSAQARGRGLRFDSHIGLPEDLKNVAVKRYISESKEPSLLGWLMGYKRQRTGDEILQNLAANKEKANDLFRKILQEEGSPKQAGDDSMEKTLQDLLANCIDLSLLFKHCHWNAKGTMFKPLHDFLDEVYERLVKTSDDIAERMVALDYPASGLISQISASSAMKTLPLKFISCPDIVSELTTRLSSLCEMFNKAIKTTESDPVTSNMLQDMTHTLEKSLWMLRRQKENSDGVNKTAAALVLNQMFQ